MKTLSAREGRGYEVQFYDDKTGENTKVMQVDTADELAQYLARCCWGRNLGRNLPSIWKDGGKWCFGEFTPAEPVRTPVRHVLLREVSDPSVIYGLLLAETSAATGDVIAAFLSAKADAEKGDCEWQVADILPLLPPEWNARVEEITDVQI